MLVVPSVARFRVTSVTLTAVVLCLSTATVAAAATQRRPQSARGQERLLKEVRHELVMLPYYGVFDHLAYRINGDEVELLGYVTRPTLKSAAESVVKGIEGVEKVTNRIEVLPLSPHDDRIRLVAYRSIYGHAGLDRYALQAVPPIHIIVKNGQLTLEGVVGSELDRTLAHARASSVPGVFSVANNLKVEVGAEDKATQAEAKGGSQVQGRP